MSTQVSRWLWLASVCGAVSLAEPRPAAAQGKAPIVRGPVSGTPSGAAPAPTQPTGAEGKRARGPRAKARRPVKGEAVVTFPGFRLLSDGRSRVFVELTKMVSVDERRGPTSVTYTLRGANVPVRNNRNPLVTAHFPSAVSRARLVRTAADVELVIELRAQVTPSHQIVNSEGGGARLEVDFPAGDYPISNDAAPARPASDDNAAAGDNAALGNKAPPGDNDVPADTSGSAPASP